MVEKIFIITLLVWAIHIVFQDGMIFEKTGNWLRANLPEWLSKPLFDCPACMTPYYGSGLYWLIFSNNWVEYLIVVFCAMGISAIIITFIPE